MSTTPSQLAKAIGGVVRQWRKERAWSIRDLERVSGVRRSVISRVENGKADARLNTLIKLAEPLDAPLSELFREAQSLVDAGRKSKGGAS